MLRVLSAFLLLVALAPASWATIDTWDFETPEQQKRYITLTEELRCPKCDGQSIGGSNAPIANDLREVVYNKLVNGESDQDIVDFMVDRYGEFVLYRPRATGKTFWLWAGPFLFFGIGLVVLLVIIQRSRKMQKQPAVNKGLTEEERRRVQQLLDDDASGEGKV
ncbi:cytochrome c-type biogenesis protein CcmH [Sansalvadorimonas sp. 2012CJ34-2]|uniref:Cytochrome c-type biogenesis protein n=1 Tax=Parendozoicomonas callyspongiae TaxID=2942213 RepID=A0ABT0PJU1_9GAMM|nr:cytochrome c-type biogenesis protein [Sansalvadorimonas sp. 2012CJ34-2]MCL6271652.1 cytochrome c-type biogenesis protein CcmH [Sansalvadorimonas sp. 2012CJ34-2]